MRRPHSLLSLFVNRRVLDFGSGGLQPLHIPLTSGVRRRRADADVPAVRQRDQLEGLHRPRHQPEQVLR